jgi:glycosyltransferase involved in cell wall biosynthesis
MRIIQSVEFLSDPVVSVVIPSFNRSETLGEALDSILKQSCNFEFEIVIGDDFSTDNSREILIQYQKKYPRKIKLIFQDENVGLGSNWAICVQQCHGKYITNCDNDDYWHNDHKLQIQVDYLECHLECGLLHTDYDELNVFNKKIIHNYLAKLKKEILVGYRQKEIFNGQLIVFGPSVCFRKELFDKHVPVNKYIELNFPIEDWPTWIILSKYTETHYLPISTMTYRVGQESLSNLRSYEKVLEKFAKEKIMYKFLCDMFPDDLTYVERDYDNHINRILLNLAYKKGDFKTAKLYGHKLIKNRNENFKINSSTNLFLFYLIHWSKKIKLIWSSLFIWVYLLSDLSII